MRGSSTLQMICAEDLLQVRGDFNTESTMNHSTMLTSGRMKLTDVTNEIWELSSAVEEKSGNFTEKQRIGDIDCATENVLIEVKTSVASVEEEQIRKYKYNDKERYFNVDDKAVILYIDKAMTDISAGNAKMIERIKSMGVTVVNSWEELGKELQKWECPDLS